MKISFDKRSKLEKTEEGIIPGILYGPNIDNTMLKVDSKDFEKAYEEAGESSLVSLEGPEGKYLVLIHDIQTDPITRKIIHVDFYQPNLKEEVEVPVPLVFEGIPPAVKELGGTLVKNFMELEVKALPEKLPQNIKIDTESLKTFDDAIAIKDIKVPGGVKILKDPEEIIALVMPIEDIEEDLEKPIEGDVESVEKVEGKKKEEEDESDESAEK